MILIMPRKRKLLYRFAMCFDCVNRNLTEELIDEEKLKSTEFRYGKITKKVVIYRGENTTLENGIEYRNVEDYLKSLL